MKILVKIKGGSGSGNFNHAGIPGHQGGSAPKLFGIPDTWEWDSAASSRMQAVSIETSELYGTPSNSVGSKLWTSAVSVWYGDDEFRGGWHPEAKNLQREILEHPLPRDEILYRGVYGDHSKELQSLAVGDEVVLERFSSTSRSQDVSHSFKMPGRDFSMLIIHAKEGTPALYIHAMASEFLLPAYTKLKVIGKVGQAIHVEFAGVDDPYA